jgi:hypothetical protein
VGPFGDDADPSHMTEERLRRKIEETRRIGRDLGLDLAKAPLLAVFDMPLWSTGVRLQGVSELSRVPLTQVAVLTTDPLPETRDLLASLPRVHAIAERGLVCGLSGGAVLHVYPTNEAEMVSFAAALFAGAAPAGLRFSLGGHLSSGRQEVCFEQDAPGPSGSARELLHAVHRRGGVAELAAAEDAVVADDIPANLSVLRAALSGDLPRRPFRVTRLPSGRFRLAEDATPRPMAKEEALAVAQGIAISCDRYVEARGTHSFGLVTEPVARWAYGPERAARTLAQELFAAPESVITHLGLHPFSGERTLFFAYEGTETVWEAANKGVSCITVRDMLEYARILVGLRKEE